MDNYSDIINMPHHVSKKHPQMSLYQRSAQFAPFSPLTGYESQIDEASRLTSNKIEIDDDTKEILDIKLQIIMNNLKNHPKITIKYFIPDTQKAGGSYKIITDRVLKIDNYNKIIIFENENNIKISDIIEVDGEILKFDLIN